MSEECVQKNNKYGYFMIINLFLTCLLALAATQSYGRDTTQLDHELFSMLSAVQDSDLKDAHDKDIRKIKSLLKKGASPNNPKFRILATLISTGDIKLVEFFLKNGADPKLKFDTKYFGQVNPLLYTAIMELYWSPEAFVGRTAADDKHLLNFQKAIIELLIKHGADINDEFGQKCTVLDYVTSSEYLENAKSLIKYLKSRGARHSKSCNLKKLEQFLND